MRYYIGIDLGGMSAVAALADEKGTIYGKLRRKTNAGDGAIGTAHKLSELIRELKEKCPLQDGELCAVGIGSPGVIDSARGVVVKWSNFGWKDVPLAKLVSDEVGLPVFVTNDANAAALGEAKYGSGKSYRDSALITLGTGVGGGIVLGGKLLEGYRSAGGELGHIVIKRGGYPCTCGRRGCLECYASATALKRETRRALLEHRDTLMWEGLSSVDELSGKTAFVAARKGDEVAEGIVSEYVECLGEGIANLVNVLRPEVIILGGGVAGEGEYLVNRVREYVEKNIYVGTDYAPLEITTATLGNDAGVYGAFAYAMERG